MAHLIAIEGTGVRLRVVHYPFFPLTRDEQPLSDEAVMALADRVGKRAGRSVKIIPEHAGVGSPSGFEIRGGS